MGLLKKFKNIFIEEVEEDFVPPKKENVKKDIPVISRTPKKIEEQSMPKTEQIQPIQPVQQTKEEKFVFPVYFDDKDFQKIEKETDFKPKKVEPTVRREVKTDSREVRKESSYKEAYNKKINDKEEKKVFKPTPIISPVYGILDKNYYKEDIVVTTPSSRMNYNSTNKAVTIDDVRNKAFGTLEEDIEQSLLFDESEDKMKHAKHEEDNSAIFDEFDFANAIEEDKKRDLTKDDLKADIEALLENDDLANTLNFRRTKIEEHNKATSDLNNNFEDMVNDDKTEDSGEDIEIPINISDNEIENAYNDSNDLNDSDLFNLIDSMYDKEEK